MRSSCLVGLVISAMAALGCAQVAEGPPTGEPASVRNEAAQEATDATPPTDPSADGMGGAARSPEPAGTPSTPYIAEMRSLMPVVNIRRTGRLEVVDGCLTVTVEGEERATAVFPPGARPEMRDGELVAISFDDDRIPVGQETNIPGGAVDLSSGELVRPVPDNCPQELFGLGG